MTRTEQRRFIEDLTTGIAHDIIRILPRIPSEWDGRFLSALVANHCSRLYLPKQLSRRERHEFNNTVACRPL